MVIASFSIISQRAAVIEYSAPYYHSGFSLMTIARKDMETKWFSYLDPYPSEVWAMIVAAAIVAFAVLVCSFNIILPEHLCKFMKREI